MSRKLHIEFPGAIYYLQLKGNEHRRLFNDHRECEQLRRLMPQLCAESRGQVLGYCLLHDSVHLLLKTPDDGHMGSTDMGQWLTGQYTDYYNQLHNRNGSVFHNHFPCVLIEPNHYLLPVIHKLHNLPVAYGLVPLPAAYPWSSHRDYLSFEPPTWLNRDEVFRRVANHRAMQMRRYEHFIEDSQPTNVDWISGVHPHFRALASDHYIQRLIASSQRHHVLPAIELDTLAAWVCEEYGLAPQDLNLWRRHRLVHEVRAVIAALALRIKIASLEELGDFFDCDTELLETGIRALDLHRGMYLFRLQLQLDKWLLRTFSDDTGGEVKSGTSTSIADGTAYDDMNSEYDQAVDAEDLPNLSTSISDHSNQDHPPTN